MENSSNAATKGSHNHGTETKANVRTEYGLDRSSYAGKKSDERGTNMGGSTSNLSHSLSGVSANQKLKG